MYAVFIIKMETLSMFEELVLFEISLHVLLRIGLGD